jgi:BirA family biotin operon repressor/biotin-[acetyl-CoA-carboxylase] ligase
MFNDNLSSAAVIHNLKTSVIGQRIIYYPRLSSTMDTARQEARQGATEGTVVIADEQTAGKGRMKRAWFSPRGSIALSIILYPEVRYLPYLNMLASLAAVHSIETVTTLEARIKWPNDVFINGKKVCGILIESDMLGNKASHTVIGIGINVNFRTSDFPEITSTATSLADELGKNVSRIAIIQHLLVDVEKLYSTLPNGESIYQEWRDRLVTLGSRVQVKSADAILEGTIESVNRDGSLLLRHSNGSLHKIIAGDVSLRDYQATPDKQI